MNEMTTEECNLKNRIEYLEGEIQIHIVNERAWIERCEKAESSLEREKERADKFQGEYLDLGEINQHLRMEIFELKEKVKELEVERPVIPLKYCKEHKTICLPFNNQMACCLESNLQKLVEALVEALEEHKRHSGGPPYYIEDEELYKVLEEVK